ncbi:MAG: hypothetical protein IH623_30740 [Verrucomicrobia bacterium]|nr:hypothetical protein [Verrucomicrobiota bacterium]
MTFNPQELLRLEALASQAAHLRNLTSELALATTRLPEIAAEERRIRETIPNIPPSKLLEFGPEVREIMERLRRVEFIRGELSNARSIWGSLVSQHENALKREIRECSQIVLKKVDSDLVGEARGQAHRLAHYYNLRGSIAEQAEQLLAACRQLGAAEPATLAKGAE